MTGVLSDRGTNFRLPGTVLLSPLGNAVRGMDSTAMLELSEPTGLLAAAARATVGEGLTSSTLSSARMWSRVSSVGDSPPCKQKICTRLAVSPAGANNQEYV